MKHKMIIWSILFIGILSVLLIPRLLTNKGQEGGPSKDGKGPGKPARAVAVAIQVAKLSSIEEKVMVTGTIHASKDIEIRNEISGRVVGVYFKEATAVKKDQLLLKLNDSDLQAQLLKAQSNLRLAKDKEVRQKGLLDKEIISTEEYQNSLGDRERCEADVQLLLSQIGKTKITAPFAGVIGLTMVNEGTFLSAGSVIANLVSVNELDVECNIPERYAPSLSKGLKLTFTLSGNSNIYNGVVSGIEPKIDDATRTVAVKAHCVDSDKNVIAGSFAKIFIVLNQHEGILVPSNAIISDIEGYKIYTVRGDQSFPQIVKTGYRDEKSVEIVSGIKAGDTLITTGAFMLRPKTKIEIQNDTEDKQYGNKHK